MGRIVYTTNMSLDGVVQVLDGQEGFARGGWSPTRRTYSDQSDCGCRRTC
jgi:hypothetical protein